MKNKKSSFSTFLLILMLIFGVALLLYPTVSDYWNSKTQSKAVARYEETIQEIDEDQFKEMWNAAKAYNKKLQEIPVGLGLPEEMKEQYYKTLAVSDSGIIGTVEIPAISVSLPIYHGTSEDVLQVAVGHIDWTSLPTGGIGTHCAISGHRGLPSAKLFTNVDQLKEGDIFMLRVLDEILTYEVDRILIVEPNVLEPLGIEEGKDLCTLVTCTPYGVNTHRLLIRGHRIENVEEAKTVRIISDAIRIEPFLVAPVVAVPIMILFVTILLIPKKKKDEYDEE